MTERLYHLLLYCYPAEFRHEYAQEMTLVFRDRLRAEPRVPLWMDVFADLVHTALKEHLNVITRDLVYAVRSMAKTPLVAAAVIATLALAIGANTAIFSVVQAVLINPFPYPHPERLVRIWESNLKANTPFFSASVPNFVDFRDRNRAFQSLAAWRTGGVILMRQGEPERINAAAVSGSLFEMLGYQPILGRGIQPADETSGAPAVIVLTRGLWESRFGADPHIVGKSVNYGGGSVPVVGVVANDDVIFDRVDAFAPLRIDLSREGRGNHTLRVLGRLRDGVSLGQADADLKTVSAGLGKQYPYMADWNTRTDTAFHWIVPEELRRGLAILLAAVGMVLLIACANVSNLLLARAMARGQEMAVRKALGAATGRLVRQLLTESALLAVLAGTAGVLAAYWGVALLRGALPADWPRAASIAVSRPVLAFSAALTLFTGVLFGLAPAWRAAATDVAQALKSGSRSSTGGGRWLRYGLVAGQLALATALTAGAALFLQSLLHLRNAPMGFAPDHLLVAHVGFPAARYPDGLKRWTLCRQFLADVRSLPGVGAAGIASIAPLEGGDTSAEMYPVGPSALAPTETFFPQWRFVDGDFFKTLGVPLKAGRLFDDSDDRGKASLIVSESYARKLWPNENAIGRQVRDGSKNLGTIVGVVGDVRNLDLREEPIPINYYPAASGVPLPMTVLLRTAGDPLAMTGALRERMKRLDPTVPIYDVRTMDQLVSANSARTRWNTGLIGAFAVLALILGGLGIYGVLAYAVTLRTREIGVRMALGAASFDIVRLVVLEGMALALAGVAAGVVLALSLGRLAANLLYGVTPHDSVSLGIVAVLMTLVALSASLIPAARAARVDPLHALRME